MLWEGLGSSSSGWPPYLAPHATRARTSRIQLIWEFGAPVDGTPAESRQGGAATMRVMDRWGPLFCTAVPSGEPHPFSQRVRERTAFLPPK